MKQTQDRLYPSKPDYWVLAVTGLLMLFGLAAVYSVSMAIDPANPTALLERQLLWSAIGGAGLVIAARFDYRRLQLYTLPLLGLGILALLAVLLTGSEVFGSRRWFFGGSVQPSEFMKLALVIYVAYWLSTKGPEIKQATYGLVPFSVLVGLVTGLILMQPDFSTAVLIAGVAMIMFFVAGADVWQLVAAGGIGLATAVAMIVTSPYRLDRVFDFRAALRDPLAADYHVRQTVLALGSGGLAGRGLGGGILKFGWLPAAHTDSIYAVIGEELGFIGCMAVLLLFSALAWRGFRIAARAQDPFGTFLAAGLTIMLVLQAGLNIAVATATVPFTGVPLPFISFGGSSLVVSLVAVGIVFNVSGHRIEG